MIVFDTQNGWCRGENNRGQQGWFPENFVKELDKEVFFDTKWGDMIDRGTLLNNKENKNLDFSLKSISLF